MRYYTAAAVSALAATHCCVATGPRPVHRVATIDNTLFENIAVRANGQILVTTSAPAASLYQVDPSGHLPPVLAASLPGVLGTFGITELRPDVFYVAAGNFSIQTFKSVPGSWAVFEVDMTGFAALPDGTAGRPPQVRHVAALSKGQVLNGVTHMAGETGYVLVADSYAGLVWRVDVASGAVTVAVQDASMATNSTDAGINGLKANGTGITYTNSGSGGVFSMPLSADGTQAGPATQLATLALPDDLAIDGAGNAYVCEQIYALSRVGVDGAVELVAGTPGSNASSLLGPSSAASGRRASDRRSLYVTTNGGQAWLAGGLSGVQGVWRIDFGDSVGGECLATV